MHKEGYYMIVTKNLLFSPYHTKSLSVIGGALKTYLVLTSTKPKSHKTPSSLTYVKM
jgi:hypothetical protein